MTKVQKIKPEEKKSSGKGELQKATPTRSLSPFEEMDRLFESMMPRSWMSPFRWERPDLGRLPSAFEGKTPKVDVIDRDDEIVVHAELPGVDKKDLDISMTDNTITIKGSTRHEEKEEKGDYYRCEISSGSYSRTVALPGDVNSNKTKATYKDGILEITMPKVEKSRKHSVKVE
jgi:HSP20 family protein